MAVSVPKEFVEKWRNESGEKMRIASQQQYSTLKGLYEHRLKRGRHASDDTRTAQSANEATTSE